MNTRYTGFISYLSLVSTVYLWGPSSRPEHVSAGVWKCRLTAQRKFEKAETTSVTSITQVLSQLQQQTTEALGQFEGRREAFVAARGRARKLREAANRAAQLAEVAEAKMAVLTNEERTAAGRLAELARELSAQPVTLELLQVGPSSEPRQLAQAIGMSAKPSRQRVLQCVARQS